MDVMLNLNRAPVTEVQVKSEVFGTFLCSSARGSLCSFCHHTCKSCTDGVCDSCLSPQGSKVADGAFCMCEMDQKLVECPSCHTNSGACAEDNDLEKCTISKTTSDNMNEARCSDIYATSACNVPCQQVADQHLSF